MLDLLNRIKARLAQGAFPNEASVSHGILIPLLQQLGWDPAEPDQLMPEYASGRGALISRFAPVRAAQRYLLK